MTNNTVTPSVPSTSDNERQRGVTPVSPIVPPTNNNDREVDVDVDEVRDPRTVMLRENFAGDIAKRIINLFGDALKYSFIVVLVIILVAMCLPNDITTKLIPSLNAILDIVKIVGAIFSPLLAFILGYYFSLRNSKDN